MKRPFSLRLQPIKVPPKPEIKNLQDSTLKPLIPGESISPPPSPFISRRQLSSKTESQLRAACALVLENYKPSGHVFEDNAKPKLDFDGLNRAMREKRRNGEASRQQRGVDDGANQRPLPDPKTQAHQTETVVRERRPDADSAHVSVKANTSRRREDQLPHAMDPERASRRAAKTQPSADRPKTTPMRNAIDSDDSSSLKTPLTSSTGYNYNNTTAPTSAAFSSPPGSKRDSQQCYPNDNAVAAADAAAAEWMRQEIERRRQNMMSLGEPPAFNQNHHASRPPSRSRSIRSELREYIRPLSRSASRSSMSSDYSAAPQHVERSSGHGWRSWTLHRKTSLSSFKDSRPNSSRGRSETRPDEAPKAELNLNRELPPLPSLDKWEDHAAQSSKAETHAQTSSTHIANLMLPKGRDQQQHPSIARHKHQRSGSDSLAQRAFPKDTTLYSPPQNARLPRPKSGLHSHRPDQPRYDSSITFNSSMDPSERSRQSEDTRPRKHKHSKSASTVSYTSPSMKASMDQPPNFSRKISMDVNGRPCNEDTYGAETSLKSTGNDRMHKLRKVVSGWMLNKKKDKKDNVGEKSVQSIVTGRIMAHNESAYAPVVKY